MGMTAGINALIVGNYLTTLGRSPERGPADARRPAHADRRAVEGALSRGPVTVAAAYCRWCGRAGGCDGVRAGARSIRPASAPTCGRRLRVQVTPTGYTASCGTHGAPDPSSSTRP